MMDCCVVPEPYPDELWYSLLVRYHRHSGNSKIATTKRELFGEEHYMCTMNPSGADNTLFWYIQKHGWNGEGNVQEKLERALCAHTLLPYYLRYYSAKGKKGIINGIMHQDHNCRTINLFTYHESLHDKCELRFCPECLKKDIAQYGEAYWHRTHQIWLLERCPDHGCRLQKSTATSRQASYHFYGPDHYTCTKNYNEGQEDNGNEEILWPYVRAALEVPFSFSEPPRVWAIKSRLAELGYGGIQSNRLTCDWEKLHKDMLQYWEKSERLYGFLNNKNAVTIYRVTKEHRNSRMEPALLLTAFLRMDPNTMFDEFDIDELKLTEMVQCYESGLRWTAAKLAEHLGAKVKELPFLAAKAELEPFWKDTEDKTGKRLCTFRLWLTVDERSRMLERMREVRAMDQKEYLRYCMQKDFQSGKQNTE